MATSDPVRRPRSPSGALARRAAAATGAGTIFQVLLLLVASLVLAGHPGRPALRPCRRRSAGLRRSGPRLPRPTGSRPTRPRPVSARASSARSLIGAHRRAVRPSRSGIADGRSTSRSTRPTTRFTRLIDINIRNLAGVPSIVYGLLGLTIFVAFFAALGSPATGATSSPAALTLAVLVLPIVIITSAEALRAVPRTPSARPASASGRRAGR